MDSRSNPSVRHQHHGDRDVASRRSEQIYYGGAAYIDSMNGYHPAYHKYMRKQQQQTNTKEFVFSPLFPVNSKDMNSGVPPHYPSPHNYHNNNNKATPILSINGDNRTLTSTYSFGANGGTHMHHSNTHKNKHLHHQYRGTNSHNTLFSPDLCSGDNSSDYYTAIVSSSPSCRERSQCGSISKEECMNAGGELSHQDHRYHPQYHQHKKHRGKTKGPRGFICIH
eukprot:317577_1